MRRAFIVPAAAVLSAALVGCGSFQTQASPTESTTSEVGEAQLSPLDIFARTRLGGTTGARFAAYYDASVANFGYGGAMDNARASWNGISSKVAIDRSTTYSAANDIYYVTSEDRRPYIGFNFWKKSDGTGGYIDASEDENWHHTQIVMYNGTAVALYPTDTTQRSTTIRRCAIHELGHSVKQKHNSQALGTTIMTPTCDAATGVTTYDRNELIRKWGQ